MDYNDNDDNDDYYGDGPQYQDEFKARERTGIMSNVTDRSLRNIQDPREKLLVLVDAISRSINSDYMNDYITDDDIAIMTGKIDQLLHPQSKNATAYILGYLVTRGGNKILPDKVKEVFTQVLPNIKNDTSVTKPDVLRYARLWQTLLT